MHDRCSGEGVCGCSMCVVSAHSSYGAVPSIDLLLLSMWREYLNGGKSFKGME